MKIILPTHPLVHRFEVMHQPLLDKVNTNWRDVAEYVMQNWIRLQAPDAFRLPPGTRAFDHIYDMARTDIIDMAAVAVDADDASALRKVLRSFIRKFFDQVIGLIEHFNLTDYQIQTIVIEPWLANSMVLCIYS